MRKRYTVQQLANLSGVSARTLHHYDRIGLLKPASVGDKGYRYYGIDELLRLQQILVYREFNFPLTEIGELLSQPGSDHIEQLAAQRARLLAQAQRYHLLANTISRTIDTLTNLGETSMDAADLYKGFSPERQAEYEAQIGAKYGASQVELANKTLGQMKPDKKQALMDELAEVEHHMANLLREGVDSADARVAALVMRHREWVAAMWGRPCTPEAHAGLAHMYAQTPDFRLRYESIAPGLTDYLAEAIRRHAGDAAG